MASTYTTNLGIEKIATGEQSGTWGDTTNTNFDILDEAINGVITITAASAGTSGSPNTLPITDGASSNGRNKFIEITDGGDLGADVFYQLTPNDSEKILFIRNSLTTQDLVLFQGTYNASNDIVVPNGKDMLVKFDGAGASATVTDMFNDLRATKIDPVTLSINGTAVTSTAAELNILDGVTSTASELNLLDGSVAGTIVNSKGVVYGASGEVNATTLQIGGNSITSTAAELNILDGVTSTASELNLVDGSVAGTVVNSKAVIYGASGEVNATTLQIAGNSITATAAELNVLDGITSTTAELNILDGVTATATELNYTDITTLGTSQASKVVTADANGDIAIGGDVTFTGTSKVQQTKEKITISATAATGTINYDALTQSVLYYTTDASGNFTVNVRGDGSNTLNSIMSIGEALTVAFLVTQGSTAYYNSAFQVDGSSVTPNWQGGSAPTEGTASGIDVYTYNIIKTADATFTVLASVVDFS